jgi:Zn-finger nucleic acid-binding protein
MISLELHHVEVDHCLTCGGVWLDSGEMELLLDGAENRQRIMAELRPDPSIMEERRRCPICDHKMEKVRGGPEERIILDRCSKNSDGVWLDRGELHEVVSQGEFPGENRVQKLLIDIFGDH